MSKIRSCLAGLQTRQMDAESVKRSGWAEQKILVVSLDDQRLDWLMREQIKQLGEYLYGKRDHNAK